MDWTIRDNSYRGMATTGAATSVQDLTEQLRAVEAGLRSLSGAMSELPADAGGAGCLCRLCEATRQREALRRGTSAFKAAERLLLRTLSERQRREYRDTGAFSVLGSESGRRYLIHPGRFGNVEDLSAGRDSRERRLFCAAPAQAHCLPVPDVMLAQKLCIENDEVAFLAAANEIRGYRW